MFQVPSVALNSGLYLEVRYLQSSEKRGNKIKVITCRGYLSREGNYQLTLGYVFSSFLLLPINSSFQNLELLSLENNKFKEVPFSVTKLRSLRSVSF